MPPKSKPTDPTAVGRHSGEKIWGYEVFPDGRIALSPMFADRFRAIIDREEGVAVMQQAFARFVSDEMTRTSKDRREWWNDLKNDLGQSDDTVRYQFNHRDGSIVVIAPDPEPDPVSQNR